MDIDGTKNVNFVKVYDMTVLATQQKCLKELVTNLYEFITIYLLSVSTNKYGILIIIDLYYLLSLP